MVASEKSRINRKKPSTGFSGISAQIFKYFVNNDVLIISYKRTVFINE